MRGKLLPHPGVFVVLGREAGQGCGLGLLQRVEFGVLPVQAFAQCRDLGLETFGLHQVWGSLAPLSELTGRPQDQLATHPRQVATEDHRAPDRSVTKGQITFSGIINLILETTRTMVMPAHQVGHQACRINGQESTPQKEEIA